MDYEFLGGNVALDFANTVHNHGMADPGDDLTTTGDLVEWAVQAGLLGEGAARQLRKTPGDEGRFQRALALRELVYEVFSRVAEGKKLEPETIRAFQRVYQNAIRHAEFHPVGSHYQLAWPAADHPLEGVLHEIIRSAADLLTSRALMRVGQCSGETCSWLFVDTSRNGRRRWCDMKACGNRDKVRRFRRRVLTH